MRKSAAIYVRVSTAAQEETGTSLDTQIAACRAFCAANDYNVLQVFSDSYSGAYFHERPALSALRENIRRKLYDAVIIYAIDRLSRKLAHLALFVDDCERFSTDLKFVTEDLDYSPEGKLLYSIRGYVAEIEREKIKERSLRGRKAKAENSTISRKKRIYGYEYSFEAKRRKIVESEALVIKRIFAHTTGGGSMRQIAAQLDAENVSSPGSGACWSQSTIRRILENPIYAGQTFAFRYQRINKFSAAGKRQSYTVLRPKSEWILQQSGEPAIVTPEEFASAALVIEHNRQRKRTTPKLEFLLRGRVACGVCGRRYAAARSQSGYHYYICDSRRSPRLRCGNSSFRAKQAENTVWRQVEKIITDPEHLRRQIARTQTTDTTEKTRHENLKQVRRTVERTESELKNLINRAESVDDYIWQIMQERIKLKNDELSELRKMAARLERETAHAKQQNFNVERFISDLQAVSAKIAELDFKGKMKILDKLKVAVIWKDSKLKIHLKILDDVNE